MANLLFVLCLVLLAATAAAAAFQFKVGGSGRWTVLTDDKAMSYNQWAERNRFRIGDSLLFVYPAQKDSVLQVDKGAYNSCNTSAYIQKFDDGNTVIKLDRSGPFFFISGVEANCIKNESLHVVVLAERINNHTSLSSPPSLPPLPASPSPSPATEASSPPSPAPSPTGSTSTSPPPSPTGPTSSPPPPTSPAASTDGGPSPAPAAESSPPPNGSSGKAVAFVGSIGALLGSLLVL